MNPDGTGLMQISDHPVDCIVPHGGMLYYIDRDENAVMRANLDGGNPVLMVRGDVASIDRINVADDYVYFSRWNFKRLKDSGLYRMRKGTLALEPLLAGWDDFNWPYLSIAGGKIYCVNLVPFVIGQIPVSYYRVNLNGTCFQLLWEASS
ncbi:MAG: DUF5050 domain-containing protein [Thermodesulfobacteriota bacterium]